MNDEKVVPFTGVTRLDTPPEKVLNAALEAGLGQVVIVGFDKEGDFYFASSQADGGDTLWLIALAQKKLLEMGDSD